jgi:hypothetical protein
MGVELAERERLELQYLEAQEAEQVDTAER